MSRGESPSASNPLLAKIEAVAGSEGRGKWSRLAHSPARTLAWKGASVVAARRQAAVRLSVRTFYGARMHVYAPEIVSRHIFQNRAFELDLTRAFVTLIRPGWTVYDVGAHFGYFSLLAASLVGTDGEVHAFEPTPSTRRVLSTNVRDLPQVLVIGSAAWREETTLRFNDYGLANSAFNSAFAARPGGQDATGSELDVQAISLDAYSEQHGAPDFVKIDAESAEGPVLEGMSTILQQDRPIVSVEVGDFDIAGVSSSRDLLDSVVSGGYVPVKVLSTGPVRVSIEDRYTYDNVLLVPEEQTRDLGV